MIQNDFEQEFFAELEAEYGLPQQNIVAELNKTNYNTYFLGSIVAILMGASILVLLWSRGWNLTLFGIALFCIILGAISLKMWSYDFKFIEINGNEILVKPVFGRAIKLYCNDIQYFTENKITHNDSPNYLSLKIYFKNNLTLEFTSDNVKNYFELKTRLTRGIKQEQ